MYRGGTVRPTQGFTIVETLIVLAVTGALFAMAALLVSGRQSKTEFQVGSRLIDQQIQQVINETQTGFYPSKSDFICTVGPSGALDFTGTGLGQGTNNDCVFVGKTIVFNSDIDSHDKYTVYSLAGRRLNDSGNDVTSPEKTEANVFIINN